MKAEHSYSGANGQVEWNGISLSDLDAFKAVLCGQVMSRIDDAEMMESLERDLMALAQTDFDVAQIKTLLESEQPEERDWAIGEAIAECLLESQCSAVWPWNGARDKKTPLASLPGADLVGLICENGTYRLLFGEVKTSTDANCPPNVMYGRSGMIHQIDELATKLNELLQVIKWLYARCKGLPYENEFLAAMQVFVSSGLKDIRLYGVLVRDTSPAEKDLSGRGATIAKSLAAPTTLKLHAYYLPCKISELPALMKGGDE